MKYAWIPTILIAAALGCQTPSGTTATTAGAGKSGTTNGNSVPSDTPVPDSLKHDGYQYYGLGNADPITLEVSSSGIQGIQTGTQSFRLVELKDGEAIYEVDRTGNLESLLGSMKLAVTPDGIYVRESSIAKVGDKDIEMPAKLETGATWSSKTVSEQEGKELNIANSFKVVGVKPIKTKVADYPDALLIESTGEGTVKGQKVRMETKSWYVKGRGGVRAEVKSTDASGTSTVITIQESK